MIAVLALACFAFIALLVAAVAHWVRLVVRVVIYLASLRRRERTT